MCAGRIRVDLERTAQCVEYRTVAFQRRHLGLCDLRMDQADRIGRQRIGKVRVDLRGQAERADRVDAVVAAVSIGPEVQALQVGLVGFRVDVVTASASGTGADT